MRSSAILSAWLWWRSGRLIEAARRAREAGHPQQAAALLDRAEACSASCGAAPMRDALTFVKLLPVLAVLDLAFWLCDPERRVVRSAVVSGPVVGRVAPEAAW